MKIRSAVRTGEIPGGSYLGSCDNISYDPENRTLAADCESFNGSAIPCSLSLPYEYSDIVNCNGGLYLNDCSNYEGIWID